jgi:hypothetical protein
MFKLVAFYKKSGIFDMITVEYPHRNRKVAPYVEHEVWFKIIPDCDRYFKPLGALQYDMATFNMLPP